MNLEDAIIQVPATAASQTSGAEWSDAVDTQKIKLGVLLLAEPELPQGMLD